MPLATSPAAALSPREAETVAEPQGTAARIDRLFAEARRIDRAISRLEAA